MAPSTTVPRGRRRKSIQRVNFKKSKRKFNDDAKRTKRKRARDLNPTFRHGKRRKLPTYHSDDDEEDRDRVQLRGSRKDDDGRGKGYETRKAEEGHNDEDNRRRRSFRHKLKDGKGHKRGREKYRNRDRGGKEESPVNDDEDVDDDDKDDVDADDDVPREKEDKDEENSKGGGRSNEGWADAMAKILNREVPKKSAILAKGLTDREIAEKKSAKSATDFEIDPTGGPESTESRPAVGDTAQPTTKSKKAIMTEVRSKQLQKKSLNLMGRVKPDATKRTKELALQRIATKGIVQLFNAVRSRQKTLETKIKEIGGSEVKREKILKSMTKTDFIDVLKRKAKSIPLEQEVTAVKNRFQSSGQDVKPVWKIFRDDYMMGATLKDWDKESESEAEAETKDNETKQGDEGSSSSAED